VRCVGSQLNRICASSSCSRRRHHIPFTTAENHAPSVLPPSNSYPIALLTMPSLALVDDARLEDMAHARRILLILFLTIF
jgi:hypothetical protein